MTNQTNNSFHRISYTSTHLTHVVTFLTMSAIIIHSTPNPTEASRLLPRGREYGSSSVTINSETDHQRTLTASTTSSATSKQFARVAPLKESLSTARFVLICVGIWSANFVFAFQSTAIPTLAVGVTSGFGHAELAAYLGSIFSLTSAAGECCTHVLADGREQENEKLIHSNTHLWGSYGQPGTSVRYGYCLCLLRAGGCILRFEPEYLASHCRTGFRWSEPVPISNRGKLMTARRRGSFDSIERNRH